MRPIPGRRVLQAALSTTLEATLGTPRPLLYRHGAYPLEDLPAHVRAASSVRKHGSRLVILQDDVNALAVLDPATGSVNSVLLPAGPDRARVFDDARGNKQYKLDLEASIVLPDGRLVAFGSGSAPPRERIVTFAGHRDALPQQFSGEAFYRALREHSDARRARLNVEGAVIQGDRLRLLQRGNGKRGFVPWNAVLDLPLEPFMNWLDGRESCPRVTDVLDVHLGDVRGVPFGFTDGVVMADGRLAFVACAEDTLDAMDDGPVLGCRFGWLEPGDQAAIVAPVRDETGSPTLLKLEGIETRAGEPHRFDVVADVDSGDEPALIAELSIRF